MDIAVKDLEKVIHEDNECEADFLELLSAKGNAFTPWYAQRDQLAPDPRYLSLRSDARRKVVFGQWQDAQETSIKSEQEFVKFIKSKYEKGLIYPLFRRKVARLSQFSACKLPEKTKESLFRQYVIFQKLKEEDRKEFIEQYPAFA